MKKLNNVVNYISKYNSYIFFVSYFFVVASDLFNDVPQLSKLLQIIDVIAILLLSFIIFSNYVNNNFKVNKKKNALYVFALLIIISSFMSHDRSLLKLPFLLLAFDNIYFDDFIKKDLMIRIYLVCIMFLSIAIGFVDNNLLEVRNGLSRYSFGTGHPNSFALFLFIIFLDYLYLHFIKNDLNNKKNIIISILLILFVFLFIGSKTCIILIILSYLLFTFKDKINVDNQYVKIILCNSFYIAFCLSIILGYIFDGDCLLFRLMDKVLSKRLFYSHEYLINYKFNFFGRELVSGRYMILDNAYVNLFLRYGIFLSLSFIYLFNNSLIKLYSKKKTVLIFIIALTIILGFSECAIYIPAKNPYILLLAVPMINRNDGEKKCKKRKIKSRTKSLK